VSRVLRTLRVAAPIAVVFALLSQTGAYAATVNVSMTQTLRFSPDPAKAKLGDTIKWTNTSTVSHTSTQDSPLSLWDSGTVAPNGTFSFTITAAGLYPYHCIFHQASGMVGTAGARDIVTPAFGPIGTVFTVKVATVTAPTGFVYDIQKANPGGGFTDWMTNVTSTSKTWDSTGQAAGTYKFRSRLRNTSSGAASGYSPAFSIQIR
jgi:plastocyanin